MPDRPLLFFSRMDGSSRNKRNPAIGRGGPRLPDVEMQADRLTPQFDRLVTALERQRLVLQDSAFGLQPEQALVIETVGSVDNFIAAVRRIEGLEWLGEGDLDEIEPNYGFENEQDPDAPLKGQLFLMMTDLRALNELRRLFELWKQDRDMSFPWGLSSLKYVFNQLHTIRPWDAEDRIRDTGIFEDWQYRVQHEQQMVPFEAELWFRNDLNRRVLAESFFQSVVESVNGEVIHRCIIPDIAYHGLLGQIPISSVTALLQQTDISLLQCQDVMYLRPVGQCSIDVFSSSEMESTPSGYNQNSTLPSKEPTVALLDGLPLSGHQLLNGRLIIDDPDDFEEKYQAHERVHGTAMASLICHGDLGEGSQSIDRQIYVRPIMYPVRYYDERFSEAIPEGILPLDLIHRAVLRLFEGEGDLGPVAPTVRVINLSVCDRSRPFDRSMSAWARLLDWLSWKYKVLFIVSAGNYTHDIQLNIARDNLSNLTAEQLELEIIKSLAEDTRHRRLLAPAETLNGVTVAALHADASGPLDSQLIRSIDPYRNGTLPSIVNAHGPGYRRAVKPDIMLPGGRQPLGEKLGNTHSHATLQVKTSLRPPGQCVATPGTQGEINRTVYMRGTSNATAIASRWSMSLYDTIEEVWSKNGVIPTRAYDTVMIKTLLLHSATWSDAEEVYRSALRRADNVHTYRDYVARFLGYGTVNIPRVRVCTDQRVTVLGVGDIRDGDGHEFRFPLPPSLSATTERRRLSVTLAWISPVDCLRQKYRVAHLWFDPANPLAPDRVYSDHRAVQRGTAQHEVLEGARAVDFQDGEEIVVKVNCRSDAASISESIAYGLAVTLEVAEEVRLPVYEEVEARLRVRVAAG